MPSVRFRLDLGAQCSIGPGKIELLEAIARTGSLRWAAVQLRMSYRRAWLLIDSLNHSFTEPATTASVGGVGGGGVELTSFGAELVRRYRIAERRIEALARTEFAALARKVAAARSGGASVAARRRLAKRGGSRGKAPRARGSPVRTAGKKP
jgi:molybdate transport system regulatory protein